MTPAMSPHDIRGRGGSPRWALGTYRQSRGPSSFLLGGSCRGVANATEGDRPVCLG